MKVGRTRPLAWAGAVGTVAAATSLCMVLYGHLDLAEIAMAYVLAMVIVSVRWGRLPSIAAALLSTVAFGWGFVPPRFTFAIADLRFLITFVVMFTVGIVVSTLTERLRAAAAAAAREETRAALLSSISHDLRTPLATITGSASALQDDLDPSVRRELARTIVEESQRLDRLVGNLLEMTRLQAGSEPRREWASIAEITGATLRRHERALAGRAIAVEIGRDLPMIEADEVLLENALANLVENAAKHTPPGTPVTIAARVEGGRMVVEVADRGPGIPPGSEERVFEKFFRVPGAERRGGVGLGLTIVRAVVEAHGGRVLARNRDGGGAVFRMELPPGREVPPVPQERTA